MPKRSKYPGLRSHSWKTAGGRVRTAYYLDRRADGKPDEPLGTDYAEALRRWHELKFDLPREAGTLNEAFKRWESEVLPNHKPVTRRDYGLALTQIRPVFGGARWADVTLPVLRGYLKKRTAKRRGNLELSVLSAIWNWARLEGLTSLPWPAAGMERSKWKNPENAREFAVTDALFAAVYAQADQVLRDCMDIASATGLRLTDVRTVTIPADGVLRGKASKTGKRFEVDMAASPVLAPLLERRKTCKAAHVFLLSTPTRYVTDRMLTARWDKARAAAAAEPANKTIAAQLKAMYLRDMRSRAADLADSLDDAAELLQHDDKRLTGKHYRTKVQTLKTVR